MAGAPGEAGAAGGGLGELDVACKGGAHGVVLYFASVRGCARAASEERRLRTLLLAKGVSFLEVDVAEDARERAMMLAASGTPDTPQLHAGGRFIGRFERVQELEDEGALSGVLQHFAATPLDTPAGEPKGGVLACGGPREEGDIPAAGIGR